MFNTSNHYYLSLRLDGISKFYGVYNHSTMYIRHEVFTNSAWCGTPTNSKFEFNKRDARGPVGWHLDIAYQI